MGYWRRFAEKGDPNGGTEPAWPAYTTAGDEHQVLDLKITKDSKLKSTICDFWDNAKQL